MKQNNLVIALAATEPRAEPCLWALLGAWAAYGLVMAELWQSAGPSAPARAAAWALALVAAIGLQIGLREV